MTIANIQNLTIEFGDKVLFSDITFAVNEGDFVGLIGANGTGKTTLFKILTGQLEPTSGGAFISKHTNLGYLEQHACQGSTRTVFSEALTVFDSLMAQEIEIERISRLLETNPDNRDELIIKQNSLIEEFQRKDGLTYKSRTRSALMGLGFAEKDFDLTVDKLSGGQKSKLSMCKLLLSNADLMLLDEPTNHLDIAGTEWLEEFLQSYKGSAIVISHDRYFLDKITNKTVELVQGHCHTANGNYSVYQKLKEERLETERRHYESQLEEIKRIEGIIAQQRQFARERNFITAESKRKMLEKKKAELIVPEQQISKIRISFTAECETGNDVLVIKNLKKEFGDKQLFRNGNMEVYKNDRTFIIGTNGCGKSTLLKILTKKCSADEGSFSFGSNVKIGYFDQGLENLRGGKTVLDEIWDEHRTFTETTVRNYLSLFLFRNDDVFKNVDSLSGGEKAKLCILKLMLSGANVLLLDEPTNHLDILSREVLENALADFEGTIIAVSHDRYFINRLSTKIYRMTTDGFEKFDGNYDDYTAVALQQKTIKEEKPVQKINLYKIRKELESEINKLSGKIKREEQQIDNLEEKINSANNLLSTPDVAADYEKVIELTEEIHTLTQQQTDAMEEWEKDNDRFLQLSEEIKQYQT